MRVHQTIKAACCVASLMLLVGCGDGRPTRVPVSGRVLIDNQPLTFGTIQFLPAGARASQGKIDKEGRFTLTCFGKEDGAVIGRHSVAVLAGEPISSTKILWHAPKKYKDPQSSGLTQEVTGPNAEVTINLTWAGGKEFVEVEDGEPEGGPRGGPHAVRKK
jgi:hypothetical protein